MRIIINEGRKVAVPTTRFESDALYYLKYGIMDDYGNLDIYQVGGNYQDMLRKKYPELFVSYYKPGFTVDCRKLHFGDY